MRILAINTYAGSLLLGARAGGHDVVGSYEDVGFGAPIQRANFPDIEVIDKTEDWPDRDFSRTTVIAHPPCSAFSMMNTVATARGLDSKAFAPTKQLLSYSMAHKAQAIAVESVMGALKGAWDLHQDYADAGGYRLYRVLQNGCMFGVPQWRQRFWAVFIRKDLAEPEMCFTLNPIWTRVKDLTTGYEDGPSYEWLDKYIKIVKKRFKLTEKDWLRLFGPKPDYFGASVKSLHRMKYPDEDFVSVMYRFHGTFGAGMFVVLDPESFCPVVLGNSTWRLNGRNLSIQAYKRLAGFPADYIFPMDVPSSSDPRARKKKNFLQQSRSYLSKGVIPAVATWILGCIEDHIEDRTPEMGSYPYMIKINSGKVADFRIRKSAWNKIWKGEEMPNLRHFEKS